VTIRLAYSTLGCPGWTLEHAAEQVRRAGYDGLSLRLLDSEIVLSSPGRSGIARIRRAMAGFPICSIDTSCSFAHPDADARALARAEAVRYLALAQELEAPLIRVFGGRTPEGDPPGAARERVVESLNLLAPAAERAGVRIALETHDSLSASRDVAAVLERVPSPAIGALWDVHHPIRSGETPAQTYDLIGSRVIATHIKDARREGDGWKLVLMGQGELPIEAMIRELVRRAWSGWLAVEWEKKWHPEIEDPEVAVPWHATRLHDALRAAGG